jgi:hypothetical protein
MICLFQTGSRLYVFSSHSKRRRRKKNWNDGRLFWSRTSQVLWSYPNTKSFIVFIILISRLMISRTNRDDMGGVGSFERNCRSLHFHFYSLIFDHLSLISFISDSFLNIFSQHFMLVAFECDQM